ncbi:hypothetical protein GCM10009739_30560 [Microbacterium ulmi]
MQVELVDGNALAGALTEVFAADATTIEVECGGCGARRALAEAVVERDAAAAIVRCRDCTHTLLTILHEGGGIRLVLGQARSMRA